MLNREQKRLVFSDLVDELESSIFLQLLLTCVPYYRALNGAWDWSYALAKFASQEGLDLSYRLVRYA